MLGYDEVGSVSPARYPEGVSNTRRRVLLFYFIFYRNQNIVHEGQPPSLGHDRVHVAIAAVIREQPGDPWAVSPGK